MFIAIDEQLFLESCTTDILPDKGYVGSSVYEKLLNPVPYQGQLIGLLR